MVFRLYREWERKMTDTSDRSREIDGPANIPSQASSSSRLNDEDRTRGLE